MRVVASAVQLVGLAAVASAVGALYLPAGLLVGGLELVVVGVAMERRLDAR